MHDIFPRLCTFVLIALVLIAALLTLSPTMLSVIMAALFAYTLGFEWLQFKRPWLTFAYPLIPFASLIYLTLSDQRIELLWLIIIICAHDTGAYITGNLIGSHKLWPAISPGKSWEGALGGFIFSLIASYLCIHFLPLTSVITRLSMSQHIIVILLINIAGIAGDLFESGLKRSVGIKDSGTLLPGHGGVLDRLDSLLFAAPFWLMLRWILLSFIL